MTSLCYPTPDCVLETMISEFLQKDRKAHRKKLSQNTQGKQKIIE